MVEAFAFCHGVVEKRTFLAGLQSSRGVYACVLPAGMLGRHVGKGQKVRVCRAGESYASEV